MSDQVTGLIIFALILALIPALITRRKAQGFWTLYVAGVLFWPVAMIWALLAKDKRVRCPECAEIEAEPIGSNWCVGAASGGILSRGRNIRSVRLILYFYRI